MVSIQKALEGLLYDKKTTTISDDYLNDFFLINKEGSFLSVKHLTDTVANGYIGRAVEALVTKKDASSQYASQEPWVWFKEYVRDAWRVRDHVLMPHTTRELCEAVVRGIGVWSLTHPEERGNAAGDGDSRRNADVGANNDDSTSLLSPEERNKLYFALFDSVAWLKRSLQHRKDPYWFYGVEFPQASELAKSLNAITKRFSNEAEVDKWVEKWRTFYVAQFSVPSSGTGGTTTNNRGSTLTPEQRTTLEAKTYALAQIQATTKMMNELMVQLNQHTANLGRLVQEMDDVFGLMPGERPEGVNEAHHVLIYASLSRNEKQVLETAKDRLAKMKKIESVWLSKSSATNIAASENGAPKPYPASVAAVNNSLNIPYHPHIPSHMRNGFLTLGPFKIAPVSDKFVSWLRLLVDGGHYVTYSVDNTAEAQTYDIKRRFELADSTRPISRVAKITITRERHSELRKRICIPDPAEYFCWCFPMLDERMMQAISGRAATAAQPQSGSVDPSLNDPENDEGFLRFIAFLAYGGFLYLDATKRKIVGVNALSYPGTNMKFGAPRPLDEIPTEVRNNLVWQKITIPHLKIHADDFAWVNPSDMNDNGGFAYRNHTFKECNRYFSIIE